MSSTQTVQECGEPPANDRKRFTEYVLMPGALLSEELKNLDDSYPEAKEPSTTCKGEMRSRQVRPVALGTLGGGISHDG